MSWKAIAAGCGAVCGALFIGYCVYFDKKRRNDPDYRKKVMESEFLSLLLSEFLQLLKCYLFV